jgi:hypothetical protein
MSTVTNQSNGAELSSVPKTLLKQLVDSASNGATFKNFLDTHLDEAVQGAVSPRYVLDKTQTIKRFTEVFAMAAGGTATLVTAVSEGSSACGRILLTKKKHNLQYTQKINVRAEVVVEASIWLEVNPAGKIVQLHFVGDMLTPALAMGMQMVSAPRSDVEPAPA